MAESGHVIWAMDQITPEWLTGVLRRAGVLAAGQATSVIIEPNERILSTGTRIRIVFSEDATGLLPTKLFLKTVKTDQDEDFFGPSEVNYYLRDYKGVTCAPIPRCYDAVFSEEQRCYHLLLDDLADTISKPGTSRAPLSMGLHWLKRWHVSMLLGGEASS